MADPLLFVPSQFPRFGEEVRFDFTARATGLTVANETVAIAASFVDAQGVRWAATPSKAASAVCPLVGDRMVCDIAALTFGPDFSQPWQCYRCKESSPVHRTHDTHGVVHLLPMFFTGRG